jgi:hypothetical protein
MMRADEVRGLLHTRPFRPFTIHFADGGRLSVKHEDFVAISPTGRTMLVYRGNRTDAFQVVELLMVTRFETAMPKGARKPRK